MIHNIKELQEYVLKDFEAFSEKYPEENHDDINFTSNGCTPERVKFLREKIPQLPESYTKWLEKLNLNGMSVGWFRISPLWKNPIDTVENFLEAHEEPFFPQEFLDKHRMYQVGSNDTDFVYVTAGTDKYKNGEILYVEEGDPYEPEDSQIYPLADNFEQFLIL